MTKLYEQIVIGGECQDISDEYIVLYNATLVQDIGPLKASTVVDSIVIYTTDINSPAVDGFYNIIQHDGKEYRFEYKVTICPEVQIVNLLTEKE